MESLFIFNFVFIALIEAIVSSRWYAGYFQVGIPLYSKSYRFKGTANVPIGEVALNEAFKKGFTSTFVFKEIEPNIFAFRERFFEFKLISYTPLMHGRLEINQRTREIRTIGLVNWWIIAFILTFMINSGGVFEVIPFMALLLGVLYLFQKTKYDKIGKFAYEWNSRDWSGSN